MLDSNSRRARAKPEDAAKALKDAVKLLNEGDMKRNPVGRAMVVRQGAVMWLAPAEHGERDHHARRGRVRRPTPPATFDIIAGIDSAFSIVEAANPECASQTGGLASAEGLGRPGQPRDRARQHTAS